MLKWIKLLLIALLSTAAFILENTFRVPGWFTELRSEVWTLSWSQQNILEVALLGLAGLAFWLLWKDRRLGTVKWPAWLYAGILILSSLWSLFFFGAEVPLLGLLNMLALTVLLVLAAVQFYRYKPLSGYLLIPCVLAALLFSINNVLLYQEYLGMN